MSDVDPILVFAGPSLQPAMRPPGPFEWRPPASAGDILALTDRPPARLCLIDGFFDSRPAPWHKELLQLMSQGTLVFGAASLGALRAAELHPFGMVGVGAIFAAYRDGRIHGDDEVALSHAGPELGWRPLSVPMIEVRATLAAGCRGGVIAVETARRLRTLVHDIHFSARDWPRMEEDCVAAGLVDRTTFRQLADGYLPLKQRDALACLAAARACPVSIARPAPPPDTCFIRRLAEDVLKNAAPASPGTARALPRSG